jgi:hypothetical protein
MRIVIFLVLALPCLALFKKNQNGPIVAISSPVLFYGDANIMLVCSASPMPASAEILSGSKEMKYSLSPINSTFTTTTYHIKHILK